MKGALETLGQRKRGVWGGMKGGIRSVNLSTGTIESYEIPSPEV